MRALLFVGLLFVACATAEVLSAPAADAPFVCKYALNPTTLRPASLRLTPGGAPFAKTGWSHRAGVEFKLPYGPPEQGAQLTFTSGWVTMKAIYAADDGFEVSLKAPLRLSPVLTAPPGAHVTWAGSEGKQLVVGRQRTSDFEARPLTTLALPCNQTSIADLELAGGDDALYEDDAGLRSVSLDAGARVPVSVTPGGPPMEVLTQARSLLVLEETPDALHVHGWSGELMLDGWVPRAPMQPPAPGGVSNVYGVGGLGLRGDGQVLPRCATEVPLLLRFEGRLHPLGTLRKHAAWQELRRDGAWVDLALPELDWVQLTPGATFVISAASATACKG